jgi:hypothetical protein
VNARERATGNYARRTIDQQRDEEQPEHRGDRRRFLIWALMIGATTPDRVVARVVADVNAEPDDA